MRTLKRGLASIIKLVMFLGVMFAFFGIPYFVITTTWGLMVVFWHEYPVWCCLLALPIVVIAAKVIKWGIQTIAAVLMAIGTIVDRLEGTAVR